jgi:hypothetical protein
LIIPNTYGLPVAFFGAPNENELAVAVVVLVLPPDDPLLVLLAALLLALLLLELLDPHPAARSPVTATAAARLSHLEDLICALFSSLVGSVGQVFLAPSGSGGFAQVAGCQQLAPLAKLGRGPFERDATVGQDVGPV